MIAGHSLILAIITLFVWKVVFELKLLTFTVKLIISDFRNIDINLELGHAFKVIHFEIKLFRLIYRHLTNSK